MVSAKIEIVLYTSLDIKIDYASTAIRFSIGMHKVPIVLGKFIRIAA